MEHRYKRYYKGSNKKHVYIAVRNGGKNAKYIKVGTTDMDAGELDRRQNLIEGNLLLDKAKNGKDNEGKVIPVNVEAALDLYLEFKKSENLRDKTLDRYRSIFNVFAFSIDVDQVKDITSETITKYVAYRFERGRDVSTIKAELTKLFGFFKWAVGWSYMETIPARPKIITDKTKETLRRLEIRKAIPADVVEKILDSTDGWLNEYIELSLKSGMRISDVLSLKVSDVDMETGELSKVTEKTGYPLRHPLRNGYLELIKRLVEKSSNLDGYLLENEKGRPLHEHPQQVTYRLKKLVKAIDGAEWVTPHSFRHTKASKLIKGKAPINAVAAWLGHSKVRTTLDNYSHLFPSDLEDIADMD